MQMSKRWMAGCLTAFLATAGLAEMKVATVDLDKVFTAHPKTQAAEAELKKAEEAVEEEMEQVAEGLRALEADVTKLREAARSPMLSDEARATKRAEAEDKLTELQEAQLRARRTQETKLKQLREQLMASRQGIVDELLKEVAAFAEAEGFDLVLDRSGMTMNMVPLAVYSAPELDVTERLIERLKP
ncbi:MAG: OmpH family outer membrane protein [Opitutae bacterium]|jgi:outer membrane protein|nr:OmpH family outer membrane protein [Opitutae bacterium]